MDPKVSKYAGITLAVTIVSAVLVAVIGNFNVTLLLPLMSVVVFYPLIMVSLYMMFENSGWRWINGVDWTKYDDTQRKNLTGHIGVHLMIGSVIMAMALSLFMLIPRFEIMMALIAIGVIVMVVPMGLVGRYKDRPAPVFGGTSKIAVFLIVTILAIAPAVATAANCSGEAIDITFGEDSIHIVAPMVDETIAYDEIGDLGYDPNFDKGMRIWGYGTLTICSGLFNNQQFGNYTLASYANVGPCVYFCTVDENGNPHYYAFNRSNADETFEAYETLKALLP